MVEPITLETINRSINDFWRSPSFWIGSVLSLIGIVVSLIAYREANKAKIAAIQAKVNLSVRTIEFDLREMLSLLQTISRNTTYDEARRIITSTTIKTKRTLQVLLKLKKIESDRNDNILKLFSAIDAKLMAVRPYYDGSKRANETVYNAIEEGILLLIGQLSEIIGLIEVDYVNGEE